MERFIFTHAEVLDPLLSVIWCHVDRRANLIFINVLLSVRPPPAGGSLYLLQRLGSCRALLQTGSSS